MVAHTREGFVPVESTPINLDRHKNADPTRVDENHKPEKAQQKRANMLKDAPDCTIIMSISQFCTDQLNLPEDRFMQLCSWEEALNVWWMFRNALGRGPTDNDEKEATTSRSEQEYSAAWAAVDKNRRLCRGFFLNLSETSPDGIDPCKFKIDGSFIANEDREQTEFGRPNWHLQQILIEFKKGGDKLDPFTGQPGEDPKPDSDKEKVFGQLMSYAERVFAFQHRTGVFMLFVNGDWFRIMRWDRAGVIVSEAVDYVATVTGTQVLLIVLRALSRLSPEQLGLDLTAVELSEDSCGWKRMDTLSQSCRDDLDHREGLIDNYTDHPEFHRMFHPRRSSEDSGPSSRKVVNRGNPCINCPHGRSSHCNQRNVIPVFKYIREYFRRSLVDGFPRYRIRVRGQDYLVGQEVYLAFGMVGRGTRGYVALEWRSERFVFLKDCWRPFYRMLDLEGAVLKMLNTNEVPNIPTLIAYEDVPIGEGEDESGEEEGSNKQSEGKSSVKRQETETSEYAAHARHKRVNTGSDILDVLQKLAENNKEATDRARKEGTFVPEGVGMPLKSDKWQILSEKARKSRPMYSDVDRKVASAGQAVPSSTFKDERKPDLRGLKRTFAMMLHENAHLQGAGLRHYVHSRVIVEEICLPMTSFTSGKQLVRVVYHAAVAHEAAYVRCKYLHRDISSGNILIRPVIRKMPDGTYWIFWRGILADWELAKRIGTDVGALQPFRTGTWHFMSVYLLDHPGKPHSIPDEIEAFMHVIVYGATRFLKSSIADFKTFFKDYFQGFSQDVDFKGAKAPLFKRRSLKEFGQLVAVDIFVHFYALTEDGHREPHPIGKLISTLIRTCHSRYRILKWEESQVQPAPVTPTRSRRQENSKAVDPMQALETDRRQVISGVNWTAIEEADSTVAHVEEPPDKSYDDKKSLESHDFFLDLLYTYLSEGIEWPELDPTFDRQNVDEEVPSQPKAGPPNAPQPLGAPQPPAELPGSIPNAPDALARPASHQPDVPQPLPELAQSVAPAPLPQVPEAELPEPQVDMLPERLHDGSPQAKRVRREPRTKARQAETAASAAGPSYTGRVTRSRAAAVAPVVAAAAPIAPIAAAGPSNSTGMVRRTRSSSRLRAKTGDQPDGDSSGTRQDAAPRGRARTMRTARGKMNTATVVAAATGGRGRGSGRPARRGDEGAEDAQPVRTRRR